MSESDLCCAATPESSDYDADYLSWMEKQLALLREKKFDQLDLDNLIEELDAMTKRDKRTLNSRIDVLLVHLLKCLCQPDHITSSWQGSVMEQRKRIKRLLDDMPSLRTRLDDEIASTYAGARRQAARETGIALSAIPEINPFTREQILDEDFFP